ncbi:MAG: ABC transporter permease [Gemmatimonadota bacterium]
MQPSALPRTPGRLTLALLLALAAGAFTAAPTILQPRPVSGPTSTDGWALTTPLLPDASLPESSGLVWSRTAQQPETAIRAHIRSMAGVAALLLGLLGLIAVLGLNGWVREDGIQRRSEWELRRAVGATRRRLVEERLVWGASVVLMAVPLGGVTALLAASVGMGGWPGIVEMTWRDPTLWALPGAGFLLSAALLPVISLLHLSAEVAPGGSLSRRARLVGAQDLRGTSGWSAVVQLAATTIVLTSGAAVLGAADGQADLDRSSADRTGTLLQLTAGTHSPESVPGLVAELASLLPQHTVAFGSPGSWVGMGVEEGNLFQCGRCSTGGMPTPVLAGRAIHHLASPDSFRARGLQLLAGRTFNSEDDSHSDPVAVVSRQVAHHYFERGDAVGRGIQINRIRPQEVTVVGIVEDLPPGPGSIGRGEIWLPAYQMSPLHGEVVLVGPPVDPHLVERTVVAAGWQPAGPARTLAEAWERAWEPWRWFGALWWILGGLGGLAAGVGVFSTLRLRVWGEGPQIAVRRAVGARRAHIILHYLLRGGGLGLVGAALGAWLSLPILAEILPPEAGAIPVLRALAMGSLPVVVAALAGSLLPARSAVAHPPARHLWS